MCLPQLIPAAGAIAGAGAAATSGLSALQMLSMAATVIGGIVQARSQRQLGEQRAEMLDRQAEEEDIRAADAVKRGQEKVRRHLMKAGQMRGTQKAMMAAAGVETSSGSPLAVIMDTQTIAELDAQTIARNAEREAAGISSSAANMRAKADYEEEAAEGKATSSLLTTGMTVADKWYRHKRGY